MRTVNTVEELESLLSDDYTSVLRDSGGYVWWSDYLGGECVYVGCATPAQNDRRGLAFGVMNVLRPDQMLGFAPFTVIVGAPGE